MERMETSETGRLYLSRDLLNKSWFTDSKAVHLFLYLLLSADEQNGCVVTSIRKIAHDTNLSVKSVRVGLKKLEGAHVGAHVGAHQKSIIIISDYDSYTSQNVSKGTQKGTQKGTLKKENEKEQEKVPLILPLKEKEKEKEKIPTTTSRAHACTCEGFAERFFAANNRGNLQAFVEQLHRLNSDIKLIEDIRPYVDEVLARWGLSDKTHADYTDWSLHMQDIIRKKVAADAKKIKNQEEDGHEALRKYAEEQWRLASLNN